MKMKLSLNKRIALISISILIPMIFLSAYVLHTMNKANQAYNQITNSVTYANRYAGEFKERMDYSVYLSVIRGTSLENMNSNMTVNGIVTVNPYDYVQTLENACDEMAEIATVDSNRTQIRRLKSSLTSLEKRLRELDENIIEGDGYDTNMEFLDENIRMLTSIIQEGIQDYIYEETWHFADVKAELQAQTTKAMYICVVVVVGTMLLAVLLSVLATRSVTRPIKKLCEQVGQVAKGDFTAHTEIPAGDEVAVLTNSFNDMTSEIGKLVEDIKMEQANLRITETRLLQAQINPHFLYNTLDTIVWLAEQKQTEEVVSMVTLLSNFFRTTLSKGRDAVTIAEEKSHIESYLEIQHFRYQDIMDYEIHIDSDIYQCIIPKLTLQPLVENALYHGIKNKRGKGLISIYGKKVGERIQLSVVDNGKGMNEDELNQLRKSMNGLVDTESGSFGLANVNQRIRYYYGDEYGVFFESEENEGTEATVILGTKNITPFS